MTRHDIRNERTETGIKEALLRVLKRKRLAQVSVSELAAEADISRSTFYAHFNNVEEVLVAASQEFSRGIAPLQTHLAGGCDACDERQPFCIRLRNAGAYEPLVREPLYLQSLADDVDRFDETNIYRDLLEGNLPGDIIDALRRFQVSGCYAVATSMPSDADWARTQEALDTFIRGGLAAVRDAYVR